MQQVKRFLPLFLLSYIFFLMAYVAATGVPSVVLIGPDSGKVFNLTNNITFQCNASSGSYLRKIDLYTTLNGSFSKKNTSCFGELCEDSSTALLMHFNNDSNAGENESRVYDWSRNGNNATIAGASFNATGGKFYGAYEFDGTINDYIRVPDSDTLDLTSAGSIEFWINAKKNTSDVWYLLLKGPATSMCWNSPYSLYLQNGKISLILGGESEEHRSNSAITPNAWYHAAITWNGSWVKIYINGTLDHSGAQSVAVQPNNEDLRIGASSTGFCNWWNFNGSIDDFAIYNRMISAEEVSEHYNRSLVNNATANWTINSVPDGTYMWNCFAYDNESQANWSATNRTFYVDIYTPPQASQIMFSPNSTDDVDPQVNINVTANITDVSGVDTAILQYGKVSTGTYTNLTMAYNGTTKLYFASFTPDINGMWRYRIWANDTTGTSGTMNETNLSVEYELTWNMLLINSTGSNSSDFGAVYAYKGTSAKMGTLVINNTGDSLLNFDISSIPSISAYNVTVPFGLNKKNVTYIEVSATAPNMVSEYPLQITVASAGATPGQRIANGTLVSYVGGPYLVASAETYTQNVQQGTTINLSGRAKNIGNETATDVWLNWTLPEGWTNASGNMSVYLGNISSDSSAWNNIEAYVSPSLASAGLFRIYVNSSPHANITDAYSKDVFVSCSNTDGVCGKGCTYAADTDCPAPSGGAPGGGGGSTGSIASTSYININYAMKLGIPKRIDVFRGQKARFALNATNAGKYTELKGITLSITGYPQALMKIEPNAIADVEYPKTKAFEVSIDVPNYTRYGEYTLSALAKGAGSSNFTPNATEVSATGQVVLAVHSPIENETVSLIKSNEYLLVSMKGLNITASKIERQLSDAKDYLKIWDYDKARELGESIMKQELAALRSYESLEKIEGMLGDAKKYGVDAPETQKMYSLSEAAYLREDYARAEERANNALLTGTIEITGRVTLLRFAREYSWAIFAAAASLAYLALRLRKTIMARAIKRKLARLEEEEKTCRMLIADAKKEYFEKRLMTKHEYLRRMNGYEHILIEAKRKRAESISKLIYWENPAKALSDFSKEEERIRKTMEDTQKKYFESGAMSRTGYKKLMKELRAELAEVKMGAEIAKEKAGKPQKMLILVFLAIALAASMPAAFAVNQAAGAIAGQADASAAIQVAEANIAEMQDMKLGVSLANDTLKEAKILYSGGNYVGAESLARHVATIKKTAVGISSLVDDAETKIYDAESLGLDVTGARKSFDAGISAFELEDYVGAETNLNDAIGEAERVKAESAMSAALEKSERSVMDATYVLWRPFAIFLAAAAAIAALSRKKIDAIKAEKRKKRLTLELAAANKMMVDAQRKYFEAGETTKSEYASSSGRYKERMLSIKKELSLLAAEKQKSEEMKAYKPQK